MKPGRLFPYNASHRTHIPIKTRADAGHIHFQGNPVAATQYAVARPDTLEREARKWLSKGKKKRLGRLELYRQLLGWLVAFVAKRRIRAKTRANYPAPLRAIEVIRKGAGEPMAVSLARERRAFVELAGTEASKNLVRVFFLQDRAKKSTLGLGSAKHEIPSAETALVIGAGVMGAGIAHWLASRGKRVLLRDIEPSFVAKGLTGIQKLFEAGIRRGVLSPHEARQGMDRITPCSSEGVSALIFCTLQPPLFPTIQLIENKRETVTFESVWPEPRSVN